MHGAVYVGGWYDLKEKSWRTIVDCSLIAAMGPAGTHSLSNACFNNFYSYIHTYMFMYTQAGVATGSLLAFCATLICCASQSSMMPP